MRSSKSKFKYALRSVRKSEEMIRADAMSSDLLNNDQDSFWKEVKKLNSCKSILTNVIDGISGESNITNLWKKHFCNILNANVCDSDLKNNIIVQLENIQYTNDMTVSARNVSSQLKCKLLGQTTCVLNISSLPMINCMHYYLCVLRRFLHTAICLCQ